MAQVTADALRVEVGLGSTWSTPLASITWTDLTSSVLLNSSGVSFNRGRTSTDTSARPGTLSLTLDNSKQAGTEGRFTPGGTNQLSGWGLRIPIRVRAKYPLGGASFIDLWYGYIEALETGWEAGYRPTVQVSATDRLARFQRQTFKSSLTLEEQLVDGAVAAWPMDDASGSTTATDRTGSGLVSSLQRYSDPLSVPTDSSIFQFGSDSGPGGLGTALTIKAESDLLSYAAVSSGLPAAWTSATSSNTIECFFYFNYNVLNQSCVPLRIYSSTEDLTFSMNSSGIIVSCNRGGTFASGSWAKIPARLNWHHLAITQTVSGGVVTHTVYYDGASLGTFTVAAATCFTGTTLSAGGLMDGRIANVALTPSALSSTRIAQHALGTTGFDAESAATRFNRLCRLAGLASADYAVIGTTSSTISPQPVDNQQLLELVDQVAVAEVSSAYLSRSGALTLTSRSNKYSASSSFTLPAAVLDAGTHFVSDMQFVLNDVTVTRKPNGSVYRITNTSSISSYDTHDASIEMYVSSDSQAYQAAYWLANASASPQIRLTDVTVDLVTTASTLGSATVTAMLQAETEQQFTVNALPAASRPSSSVVLTVDGVSDVVTATSWRRTFVARTLSSSPSGPTYWQLDTGSLGTTTTLAL